MKQTLISAEEVERRLVWVRLLARVSLGLVWVYEGVVPKLLVPHWHPEQTALVAASGLVWRSPGSTLYVLGSVQAVLGLLLLWGWKVRALALVMTGFMAVLMVLVGYGRPEMLTDPFGALAKDACLVACAAIVWVLPTDLRLREAGAE